MKNNTDQIFITLGVILLIFVIIGIFFFASDTSDVIEDSSSVQTDSIEATVTDTENDGSVSTSTEVDTSGGFELSNAQIEALVSLGIDRDDVPSRVSAEQETCFIEALGEDRVEEIKAGDVPNAFEFVRARSCI